eukprot:1096671-Prymnesium_polylepis.2
MRRGDFRLVLGEAEEHVRKRRDQAAVRQAGWLGLPGAQRRKKALLIGRDPRAHVNLEPHHLVSRSPS